MNSQYYQLSQDGVITALGTWKQWLFGYGKIEDSPHNARRHPRILKLIN